MTAVTLKALDLLSKNGFGDGAILDEILQDQGYDTSARPLDDDDACAPGFGQAVLGACVRDHLAPQLTGFAIDYGVSLGHNPVRLKDWALLDNPTLRGYLGKVEATLASEEILSTAAALAPNFADVRADEIFGLDP